MTGVKKNRQALGVTQPDFAAYLSITTGQLAMAESGLRSLPTVATLKWGAIEILLKDNSPVGIDAELQIQSEQEKKVLQAQAQEYDGLAMIATMKLEAMRSRYLQCVNALRVSTALLAALSAGNESANDQLCLEIMQREARKKMRDCGKGPQAILKLQVDGFTYQAQRARELMEVNA